MAVYKKKFVNFGITDDKDKPVVVKLNDEEREILEEGCRLLQQTKPSTAIKQLARLGLKVLLDEKTKEANEIIKANMRKNYRTGIAEID